MVKANHPDAGFFTEYIYSNDSSSWNRKLDVCLKGQCSTMTPEGFFCEGCYERKLYELICRNSTFIGLKKIFTYQLGLYDNPSGWVKEFKQWVKHSNRFTNRNLVYLIEDVLEDIEHVEGPQVDLRSFINITNNISNSTIHQMNMGGENSLEVYYHDVFDSMEEEGLPKELIDEGKELLKDADKSDSLKKIAGNWIKNLPFKVIEKAGEWALKNPEKLAEYQEKLMAWIAS